MTGLRLPYLFFLTAFILAALLCLAPGAAMAEGELVRAVKSREDFLKDQARQKSRAEWLKLVKEFEEAALAQYDPRHASRARYLGADTAFNSGDRFGQKADYQKAEALAKRSVRDCPRCTHSPDAQLVYGKALAALGQLDQADRQLMKVELNYPGSPQVTEARLALAKVRGGPPPTPDWEKPTRETGAAKQPDLGQPSKAAGSSGDGSKLTFQPKETAEQQPAKTVQAKPQPKVPAPPKARADGQAQVYYVTMTNKGRITTVTAYVDKVTPYVYNLIPPARSGGAFRVYADIKGAVLAPGAKLQLKERTDLVQLVKMNQFKNDVVRLVLDMPEANPYRPVFLNDPPRLVFHVASDAAKLPAQSVEAQPDPPEKKITPAPASKPGNAATNGPPESIIRIFGLKPRTIIIDPGHGGKDNGASGAGLREKDIVLALAKKLQTRIEKRLGLNVHLTRSDDRFITLERRTKIAKDQKGDLFISLHVNANDLASVEGFETYIVNFATDRSAMAVAARENASLNKSIAEMDDLLHILTKNTKIAESRVMAQALHKAALTSINKKYKVRDLGVKEAPFFVLVGTNIPSILVEIGFLTNANDAARLKQDEYLNLIADGICDGLESYVKGFEAR